MILVKAEPKDISFTIEINLKEVESIVQAMELCTIEFNRQDEPDKAGAVDFFNGPFWDMLNDLITTYKV